jgi:hypothetical protein
MIYSNYFKLFQDHPSMMVLTKVLFGSIRITAYDWKDQNDAYLRGA